MKITDCSVYFQPTRIDPPPEKPSPAPKNIQQKMTVFVVGVGTSCSNSRWEKLRRRLSN